MRNGNLFLAAVACAALAACSTVGTFSGPTGPSRPLSCPSGNCDPITVKVKEIGGGICELEGFPDILLSGEATGEKKITFVLSSGNYRWSEEVGKFAFFLKDGRDDPTDKFGAINVTGGDKKTLVVHFHHVKDPTALKEFRFGLVARRTVGGRPGPFCTTLDPWIIS